MKTSISLIDFCLILKISKYLKKHQDNIAKHFYCFCSGIISNFSLRFGFKWLKSPSRHKPFFCFCIHLQRTFVYVKRICLNENTLRSNSKIMLILKKQKKTVPSLFAFKIAGSQLVPDSAEDNFQIAS